MAVLVLAFGPALLAAPACAQPGRLRGTTPPALPVAAQAPAAEPAEWTASETEARSCARSRRKLWQSGGGWIVKTVTVCQ